MKTTEDFNNDIAQGYSSIDKIELEIGTKQVKIQGNSCYAQVPRKYKDRKVLVLLLRENMEDQPINPDAKSK